MAAQNRPSCLLRLVFGGLMLFLGTIASLLFTFFLSALYPSANPVIYGLLAENNIPLPADFAWAFWSALPCLFGLVVTFLLGLGANWILQRLASK